MVMMIHRGMGRANPWCPAILIVAVLASCSAERKAPSLSHSYSLTTAREMRLPLPILDTPTRITSIDADTLVLEEDGTCTNTMVLDDRTIGFSGTTSISHSETTPARYTVRGKELRVALPDGRVVLMTIGENGAEIQSQTLPSAHIAIPHFAFRFRA